jgi:predicted dehydrogenase
MRIISVSAGPDGRATISYNKIRSLIVKNESKIGHNQKRGISRRDFMAAAAFTVLPSYVLGRNGNAAPSNKLNIAGVGVGGVGRAYIQSVSSENIVALCDVDEKYAANTYKLYPKAKIYRDFRKMLETDKSIDAVVIGTPDHVHAVVASTAIKMGKHVYCAKPLTKTIYEARMLVKTAREAKVSTQMSVQSDASEADRILCEWIWDGAIGPVHEVHVWSNRPIWPQGIERPKDTPPVPEGLDWDKWMGPAPYRPYHPAYVPFKWRGWWDFGTGALGDMGCHTLDHICKALKLGPPASVHANSTKLFPETAPSASMVHYDFPAREDMPAVKLTWYDGGLKPRRPDGLADSQKLDAEGLIFVGEQGSMLCGFTGENPILIPETRMKEYKRPPRTLPRSIGHYKEWIEACKGGEPAGCNFDIGGPLTEIVLLGNIAIRTGEKLNWDSENMKITNVPDANDYLHYKYREGWTL